MKYIAAVLLSAFALVLCGCRQDDSMTYTTSNSSGTEIISLRQDGTYTQTVTFYADPDEHHGRRNNGSETIMISGQWSLVGGQGRLPGTLPISSLVELHSALRCLPMVGDDNYYTEEHTNRVLPTASFQNKFKAITN